MTTKVLTHRGLDPSRPGYFTESSREAFTDQLARGFGLEFDLRLTSDGGLVVIHDGNLSRLSKGADARDVRDISLAELLAMEFDGCHLIDFSSLLALLYDRQSPDTISAIHLKHGAQDPQTLDTILAALEHADPARFIMFDATIETAGHLKEVNPMLHLAPSVAHPYDIARYNAATGGTLYTLEEIMPYRSIFDWVWLDEWDLTDADGGTKSLYNEATFNAARNAGFSIGLVTPELHASSPGLLGGEAHPDARDAETLTAAMKRILSLSPDLVCTDHPDLARSLAGAV